MSGVAPVTTEAAQPAPAGAPAPELSGDAAMDAALAQFVGTTAPEGLPPADGTPSTPAEQPKPEAPPQTQQDPLPSEKELSNAFAAYKRKQKALLAERQAFAAEQAKLKADREAFEKSQAEHNSIVEEGKKNPIVALERLGYTKDQILEFLASNGQIPHEVMLKHATEAQQKQLDELNKRIAEREAKEKADIEAREQSAAEQRRIESIRGFETRVGEEMVDILLADKAKYPTLFKVAKKAGVDARMQVLNEMAKHQLAQKHLPSGQRKVLAISDAMVQVEQALKAHAAIFADDAPPVMSADPRQAGAVEPANPGNIEPIPSRSASIRGVLQKKPVEELSDDERMELATAQLKGAAE